MAVYEGDRNADTPLIEAIGLNKAFIRSGRRITAARDVSLSVRYGESVAIVGESGSGKTTAVRMALGLEQPDSGQVFYNGGNTRKKKCRDGLRSVTGLIFQDPYSSMDPRWTAGQIVEEPLVLRGGLSRKEMDDKACDSLAAVGLDPSDFMGRFPQDMSGGQAQRVAIARALVSGPKLLVADEPMSAVDVSGRLQIVKVFNKLRAQGISMLMVLHDLGLAQQLADTVVVMHNGKVIETGSSRQVLGHPLQPYTRELIAAAQWDVRQPEARV